MNINLVKSIKLMKVIIWLRWFFIVKSNLIVDRLFWVI